LPTSGRIKCEALTRRLLVDQTCQSPQEATEEKILEMSGIPFGTTDWSKIERTEHKGETGLAYWRTQKFGNIRVRAVEYTPGYLADHWCVKGHILLCTEGELRTELEDGRSFTLTAGMSYQVADNAEPHRSYTAVGAKLFIVD
jgi:quercetin dioxygenase-like cupin family protein